MKIIKRFGITLATHGEMADLAGKLITVLTTALASNLFILELLDMIKESLEKLNKAITAVRENTHVALMNEQDRVRDDAFIMFRDAVALYARSKDESKRQAYMRLWAVIEQAGMSLWAAGHAEESALLKALFQELDKTEFQADITLLNTKEFYDELVTAQNDYLAIEAERTDEDVLMDFPTLRESRKEINPLVDDFLPTLQNVVRSELRKDPNTNLDWVDSINEHIEYVASQIAARRTRKKNE